MRRGITVELAIGLATLMLGASAAQATFPGKNGRILETDLRSVWRTGCYLPFMDSFNPDGSQYASFPGSDVFAGVFSPDGTKVAFFSLLPNTGQYVVTISAPDGSGQQQLLQTAAIMSNQLNAIPDRLSWLPDGNHLTFPGPEGTLWETDLTGVAQPVLSGKQGVYLAAVSPDGKQVAYVGSDGGTLYVASFPAGLDAHPIATYAPGSIEFNGLPQWSPDSKQLIFSVGQAEQIVEMSPDGTDARTVGTGPSPTWSPDGNLIAYAEPASLDHVIANADGSNPQPFPHTIGTDADWQALP